jgi:alpha-L-fucosidase
MNRRSFNSILAAAGIAFPSFASPQTSSSQGTFQPSWDSIERHTVPTWFQDAKLGIFIHWGLYSVPAWAPPTGELGKVDWDTWFTNNPYAEWYLNSLRIVGSPTYKHHIATYGKDFDYYRFAAVFDKSTQSWEPDQWAALFKKTGARYVVLTTKHHDGFRLWPSAVTNPHANGRQLNPQRDLVGNLTKAVQAAGMRMGLYYSGGLDWTFTSEPIRTRPDLMARVPQSEEYAQYADAQWSELIERYQPQVMWNDINYPRAGKIAHLFAHYYNTVPDGVINNRFGVPFADYTTPEYAKYDKITFEKWESCRGLGFSFGYNQVEGPDQVIHPGELIALLADIVSKNGNLLLNVGPKADGTISEIQLDRLHKLGAWLDVNGEAIFESRPWVRASATTSDGADMRFTCNRGALYALFVSPVTGNTLKIPSAHAAEGTTVEILGSPSKATVSQSGNDLVITSAGPINSTYAVTAKVNPAPHSLT